MITVKIFRNNKNEIVSFLIDGHAGYDAKGKDIVCAAVSAVTNMALIGLNEKLKLKLKLEKNDGGYLRVTLPDDISHEDMIIAQFLLESLVTEFSDIEQNYGKYLLVKEK